MKSKEGLKKRYNLLVDTLIMCAPDLRSISDDEIEEYLEELEGDFYTFLHINNLESLKKGGILNSTQVEKIMELRAKIEAIPPNFWNKYAFRCDAQWNEVNHRSDKILSSLGISKRKIEDNLIEPK